MNKIIPCTDYKVAGIRYATKDGTFFTENQNDVWNAKDDIIWWEFLFQKVLSSKTEDCKTERQIKNDVIDKILRGLKSENDSTQLRAIILSVEAMKEQ